MAAPNGILNGTELKVYNAGTLVAYATSCTISVNQSVREITNKDSGGAKEIAEGLLDWSVDCEGMYAWRDASGSAVNNADDLLLAYANASTSGSTRASFTITFGTTDGETGDLKYTGDAYLTSISMTGGTEESATFSASFGGNGTLTQTAS